MLAPGEAAASAVAELVTTVPSPSASVSSTAGSPAAGTGARAATFLRSQRDSEDGEERATTAPPMGADAAAGTMKRRATFPQPVGSSTGGGTDASSERVARAVAPAVSRGSAIEAASPAEDVDGGSGVLGVDPWEQDHVLVHAEFYRGTRGVPCVCGARVAGVVCPVSICLPQRMHGMWRFRGFVHLQ